MARQLETGRIAGQRLPLPAANFVAAEVRSMAATKFLALIQGRPREIKRTFAMLALACR